jgi:hypothetical protein|tara:strand:+ start:2685 stop:2972 length:288 start_codon:yes stop_codon:yes gene_type:complete
MSEVSFGQMLLFHFGSSVTLAREMGAGRLGNVDIDSISSMLLESAHNSDSVIEQQLWELLEELINEKMDLPSAEVYYFNPATVEYGDSEDEKEPA